MQTSSTWRPKNYRFEKPFFVAVRLFSYERDWFYVGFSFGYHNFVDQFAKGWELSIIPPQRISSKPEGIRLRGLHLQWGVKSRMEEGLG